MAATLRHADPRRDAAACAAIYAPYVADSAISFEDVAPGPAEFAERIDTTSRQHPWLVLQEADHLLGYAYASPHHPRAAYRWAATVAVYVDPAHHRSGAGRRLYVALFDLLRRQGLYIAVAAITLPNDASVGLHRACGFDEVGVYRQIGWKAGAWRDVSWWQLRLRDHPTGGPPADPRGPQRLGGDPA
jgi:L-amino acid N-acyltransferase YncA